MFVTPTFQDIVVATVSVVQDFAALTIPRGRKDASVVGGRRREVILVRTASTVSRSARTTHTCVMLALQTFVKERVATNQDSARNASTRGS